MVMAEAFTQLGYPQPDDEHEDLFILWGDAWDFAKDEYLTAELPTRPSRR